MIVTEAVASTKRCQEGFPASDGVTSGQINQVVHSVPMISHSYGSGVAMAATVSTPTAPMFCIASGCMAWRWHVIDGKQERTLDGTAIGYCGKAHR